mgnify:CR=1 FL=1
MVTGAFANKACQEAARYGKVNIVASSKDRTFSYIPKLDKSQFTPDADYFYICMNNTIYGTVYHELPDTGSVPLVADVSSCIPLQKQDLIVVRNLHDLSQKRLAAFNDRFIEFGAVAEAVRGFLQVKKPPCIHKIPNRFLCGCCQLENRQF